MSQAIVVKAQISQILADKELGRTLMEKLRLTRFIALNMYLKEEPVWKGDMRRNTISKNIQGGYRITTTAKKNNRPYPVYVHEGTGVFKDVDADFPSTGRVRSGESRMNRGSGGMRPNKFAKRAAEKSQPLILDEMVKSLDVLSSQLVEV